VEKEYLISKKKVPVISLIIIISFLLIFLASFYICNAAEKKQILVVFRFDDYSSSSCTDLEVKLIDAFRQHNFRCTFGVIPYGRDEDVHRVNAQNLVPLTVTKINILKNAIKLGILEVALHGYSHQAISENKNKYSEFSGLDYNSQLTKILNGKKYLEDMLDIKITTFIPPWNSYDNNTVRALEYLGFDTISADKNGVAEENSLLKFLPFTCDLIHLKKVVKLASRITDKQPVIVVLFHTFDFLEMDSKGGKISYKEFVKLLGWLASQKDVYVCSIDQSTKIVKDLSSRRLTNNKLLPPLLDKSFFYMIYFSQEFMMDSDHV